jgi:hypothetical protein
MKRRNTFQITDEQLYYTVIALTFGTSSGAVLE